MIIYMLHGSQVLGVLTSYLPQSCITSRAYYACELNFRKFNDSLKLIYIIMQPVKCPRD